ncbi:hypothetical protein O0L34_g14308 [Tuta absoluta]|nr:hypothetical protein O0L34_g14308 [Tuta absoluta]
MLAGFHKTFEDSNRPLIAPNYWIMKNIGILLPDNKIGKAFYIFLHELVTFFVFTQYMELYLIRTDLDGVLTNLKISMLSIVCIVKTNTFIFWQSSWREVFNYITEADKYERDTRDDVKGKIIDDYTKYCRRVTYFYWVLVFTTFITVTHTPLLRFLSSANYRDELRNGTELFPHIFSSWMPFDKYHSPGSWMTIVWHAFMCAYGAAIMAAYDTSVIVVLVFFGGKLDLLRERSKQMLGSGGRGVSDEHAAKMVRELHNVHVLLTK